MIIECLECGTKNTTDKLPQPDKKYRCGKCGAEIAFLQNADTPSTNVIPEEKDRIATKEERDTVNHFRERRVIKDNSNEVEGEWLKSFMLIYTQARPLIDTMAELDTEGQPARLDSLVEGYRLLPPILQSIKRMQKPSDKELRKIKGDFEKTLEMSVKAGEMALKMIDDYKYGARTALRMHFASIVGYVSNAESYHKFVKERLTKIGVF